MLPGPWATRYDVTPGFLEEPGLPRLDLVARELTFFWFATGAEIISSTEPRKRWQGSGPVSTETCVGRPSGVNLPGGGGNGVVFWVMIIAGDKISGDSGSLDTGVSGRLLMMAETSAIKVISASCVNYLVGSSWSIASMIRRTMPMTRSHTPPIYEAWGGFSSLLSPEQCRQLVLGSNEV